MLETKITTENNRHFNVSTSLFINYESRNQINAGRTRNLLLSRPLFIIGLIGYVYVYSILETES